MKGNDLPNHLKEKIVNHQIVEDDHHFSLVFKSILFENQGTTRVTIDGSIVLEPQETFEENASPGKYIDHEYDFKFTPSANPPAIDAERVWNGDKLLVRSVEPVKVLK